MTKKYILPSVPWSYIPTFQPPSPLKVSGVGIMTMMDYALVPNTAFIVVQAEHISSACRQYYGDAYLCAILTYDRVYSIGLDN